MSTKVVLDHIAAKRPNERVVIRHEHLYPATRTNAHTSKIISSSDKAPPKASLNMLSSSTCLFEKMYLAITFPSGLMIEIRTSIDSHPLTYNGIAQPRWRESAAVGWSAVLSACKLRQSWFPELNCALW